MSVETIFATAAQLPNTERATYLQGACGADATLRQRVDRLLAAHDAAGEFLESPAGPTSHQPILERPGSKIGPYKLMEQIGEGGFGLVFVAEQSEPFQRKVALKLIKPGMDTTQVIARFEAERQALALMDHPNIARVLDAGATESGRPYFVMELVRGIPITEYCDQNQLSPRERLELYITVCQAIQHAHQKGIIHRDIKPSNVMVTSHDGKPVAKVIDFGVAKAINQHLTERTIYTNFAQLLGTPLYMSPEQAEMSGLDIDTRSDIYSLGVLLYELLTGTTPLEKKRFRQAAYDEIRRLIREVEPPKPSTRIIQSSDALASIAAQRKTEPAKLSKLIRGELDWITMKSLEKDRTRRYETANGLARDIQRYLSDEPVEACPPSAGYRTRKFIGKNRTALAAATTIAVLLLAATAISVWQMTRARESERLAKLAMNAEVHQRQLAAEQRALAEQNELAARQAAEAEKKAKETAEAREAEIKAVLDFVQTKVFAAARPEGQDGGLGREVTLRRAIEAALPSVERSFARQPLIEARLRMTLGRSFFYLGDAKLAAEQYEKSRKIFMEHAGPDHADTLGSSNNLANSYSALGRHPEALKLRELTMAAYETKFGLDHPSTLASLNNLANSYATLGRHPDALKLREETLNRVRAKFGPDHADTFSSMNNLAISFSDAGRHEAALKLREEVLTLRRAKLGVDHPDTLSSMLNLGQSYGALGRHAAAIKLGEETLLLTSAKLGPDHPDTFLCMQNLANSYAKLGRHDEALKLRQETQVLRKAKLGAEHPDTLASMHGLANSYAALDRHDEALKLREETLILRRTKLGPDHPDTQASMHNLANTYESLGRHAEARNLREDTLALMSAKLGPEHPVTLEATINLARSLATVPDAKLRDVQRAIQLAAKAVQAAPKMADYRGVLGVARYRAGDWKTAIADLEQAVQLRTADDPANAMDGFFLAMSRWQLGEKDSARSWFDKSVVWKGKDTKAVAELERCYVEAAELLGVKIDKK